MPERVRAIFEMEGKMKTKKEITMWAIKSPYFHVKIVSSTSAYIRSDSWKNAEEIFGQNQKDLYKEGFRAVKGKFVWEEK